jgi:hypothetical protein
MHLLDISFGLKGRQVSLLGGLIISFFFGAVEVKTHGVLRAKDCIEKRPARRVKTRFFLFIGLSYK